MKTNRVIQGSIMEHWLDRYKREGRKIACAGNYIRIPAEAWVAFQQIKNKASGKHQTLAEANREFEETR